MTSVVAAGNGHLSEGFYRGIAPEAKVVLVKIGRTGHIPDEHIAARARMGAGQHGRSTTFASSTFPPAATSSSHTWTVRCARLSSAQCARGWSSFAQSAMREWRRAIRCCRRPVRLQRLRWADSTIRTRLDRARRGMYRSSYGPTIDGLQKPEIIAPGIWVAAPILPATPTADEAELCSELDAAADADLRDDHRCACGRR